MFLENLKTNHTKLQLNVFKFTKNNQDKYNIHNHYDNECVIHK